MILSLILTPIFIDSHMTEKIQTIKDIPTTIKEINTEIKIEEVQTNTKLIDIKNSDDFPEIPWRKLNPLFLLKTYKELLDRNILTIWDVNQIKWRLQEVYNDMVSGTYLDNIYETQFLEEKVNEITALQVQNNISIEQSSSSSSSSSNKDNDDNVDVCPACLEQKPLTELFMIPGGSGKLTRFCSRSCYKIFRESYRLEKKYYSEGNNTDYPNEITGQCLDCDKFGENLKKFMIPPENEIMYFCDQSCFEHFKKMTNPPKLLPPIVREIFDGSDLEALR